MLKEFIILLCIERLGCAIQLISQCLRSQMIAAAISTRSWPASVLIDDYPVKIFLFLSLFLKVLKFRLFESCVCHTLFAEMPCMQRLFIYFYILGHGFAVGSWHCGWHCGWQGDGALAYLPGGSRVHGEAGLWARLLQHAFDIGLRCQIRTISKTIGGFQIVCLAVTIVCTDLEGRSVMLLRHAGFDGLWSAHLPCFASSEVALGLWSSLGSCQSLYGCCFAASTSSEHSVTQQTWWIRILAHQSLGGQIHCQLPARQLIWAVR